MEALLKALESEQSVINLILSGCILLCLNILLFVGKFIFNGVNKRNQLADIQMAQLSALLHSNSQEVKELRQLLKQIEAQLLEIKKIKIDLNNIATITKAAIGPEKWKEGASLAALEKSIKSSD